MYTGTEDMKRMSQRDDHGNVAFPTLGSIVTGSPPFTKLVTYYGKHPTVHFCPCFHDTRNLVRVAWQVGPCGLAWITKSRNAATTKKYPKLIKIIRASFSCTWARLFESKWASALPKQIPLLEVANPHAPTWLHSKTSSCDCLPQTRSYLNYIPMNRHVPSKAFPFLLTASACFGLGVRNFQTLFDGYSFKYRFAVCESRKHTSTAAM